VPQDPFRAWDQFGVCERGTKIDSVAQGEPFMAFVHHKIENRGQLLLDFFFNNISVKDPLQNSLQIQFVFAAAGN
jgi:predicted ATPase